MDIEALINDLFVERNRRGLSRSKLSNELECCNKTLKDWEDGKYYPTLERLIRWSGMLGFELNYINTNLNEKNRKSIKAGN